MGRPNGKKYSDEDLKDIISSLVVIDSLHASDTETRNRVLKVIKETTGASNGQLSRVLNIGRWVLDKIG